jgi:hypothetical protein
VPGFDGFPVGVELEKTMHAGGDADTGEGARADIPDEAVVRGEWAHCGGDRLEGDYPERTGLAAIAHFASKHSFFNRSAV